MAVYRISLIATGRSGKNIHLTLTLRSKSHAFDKSTNTLTLSDHPGQSFRIFYFRQMTPSMKEQVDWSGSLSKFQITDDELTEYLSKGWKLEQERVHRGNLADGLAKG